MPHRWWSPSSRRTGTSSEKLSRNKTWRITTTGTLSAKMSFPNTKPQFQNTWLKLRAFPQLRLTFKTLWNTYTVATRVSLTETCLFMIKSAFCAWVRTLSTSPLGDPSLRTSGCAKMKSVRVLICFPLLSAEIVSNAMTSHMLCWRTQGSSRVLGGSKNSKS